MSLMKNMLVLFFALIAVNTAWSQDTLSKSIYFDFESASTSGDTINAISQLIEQSDQKYKLEVHGYTDDVGRSSYNKRLAKTRATAVKKSLTDKGIQDSLIQVIAHGEENPKYSNETSEGRAKNRRVDIWVFFEKKEEVIVEPDTPSTIVDTIQKVDTVVVDPIPKPIPEPEININYDLIEMGYNQSLHDYTIQNFIQEFTINAHRDTIIMGKNGTIIGFPADAFPTERREIVVELIEAYQPADYAFFNLFSNNREGDLLELNEAVRIRVYEMEEPFFEAQKPLSIFIPSRKKKKELQSWAGRNADQGAGIVWENSSATLSDAPISNFKTIGDNPTPMPMGERFEEFAANNMFEIERSFGKEIPEDAVFYALSSTQTNWLTYGGKIELPTEDLVACKLKMSDIDDKTTYTRLLYGSSRTAIPSTSYDANKETYSFQDMPKDKRVWILSTDTEKDLKMAIERTTISKKTLESELQKYDSVSEFYEALKELNP